MTGTGQRLKIKKRISHTDIAYMKDQENLEVYLKKWTGGYEIRYDLVFKTANSYVSHSISLKQLQLLKQAVNKS